MEKNQKEKKEEIYNDIYNNIQENFIFKLNNQEIGKNLFLTNYPNSIKNILEIKIDNQGTFWNNTRSRTDCFLDYQNNNEEFRCEVITDKEIELKKQYKSIKKYDEMYQFKKYIKVGKTHICHFQIRKNLLFNQKYLIYNKKYSLEIYDIIKNKKQSLIKIDEDKIDDIICFDVFNDNEQFLISFGNGKGNCDIISVKKKDFIECIESKSSMIPKNSNTLNFIASEKILNNDIINNDDEEERAILFINLVKFISNEKLITTSNDCYFKINDLNKIKTEQKYKNDFAVNHCDINKDKNTLLCIGDSKSINIVDLRSNKNIITLNEHFDYGIVIKYNPYDNTYFASGNQDLGCKIWDIRNLNKGSVITSWGINDNIGDLDWIDSRNVCYMENSFFSHILDIKSNKIQDLYFYGFGNGVAHDKLNKNLYINIFKGNEDGTGGILCYEMLDNKVINSFNNINF